MEIVDEYSFCKVNAWLEEMKYDLNGSRLAHLPAMVVATYYNISDYREVEIEDVWVEKDGIHICCFCQSMPKYENYRYIHGDANTRAIHTMKCYHEFYKFVRTLPYIVRISEHSTAVVHPDYMDFHQQGTNKLVRNIPKLSRMDNFRENYDQGPYLEPIPTPPIGKHDHGNY